MPAPSQPIIIIKKKGGHGGHHGGAWKVAYADFVTAMMALFIVLWLMHASPEVQKAVGGYFQDPKGSGQKTGTHVGGSGDALTLTKQNMEQLKDKLEAAIRNSPELQKLGKNVQMTVTGEGLRIELLESEKGVFFQSGQLAPTSMGKDLLVKLAQELGKLKAPIALEGHTDSQPYGNSEYTNWELSADRANAARRIMHGAGLAPAQITQVRGFADQRLRLPRQPEDPSNRRISIVVQYSDADAGSLAANTERAEKSNKGNGAKGGEASKGAEPSKAGEPKPTKTEWPAPRLDNSRRSKAISVSEV